MVPKLANLRGIGGYMPRDGVVHDDGGPDPFGEMLLSLQEQSVILRSLLSAEVQTLDSIVYEHDTQELPTTTATFTLTLPPQTSQTELIEGLYIGISSPTLLASPALTIDNAWASLGDTIIDLRALLAPNGTGGNLPGKMKIILAPSDVRAFTIVAHAHFPKTLSITAHLYGRTVPATLGGALH
jgi:hypothetical protein